MTKPCPLSTSVSNTFEHISYFLVFPFESVCFCALPFAFLSFGSLLVTIFFRLLTPLELRLSSFFTIPLSRPRQLGSCQGRCVTAKRGDSDRAITDIAQPLQTTRQGKSRKDANLTNLRTGTDQKGNQITQCVMLQRSGNHTM